MLRKNAIELIVLSKAADRAGEKKKIYLLVTNKFGSSFVRFVLEATDAKAKKDIYTPRMKDFKASDSEGRG